MEKKSKKKCANKKKPKISEAAKKSIRREEVRHKYKKQLNSMKKKGSTEKNKFRK